MGNTKRIGCFLCALAVLLPVGPVWASTLITTSPDWNQPTAHGVARVP